MMNKDSIRKIEAAIEKFESEIEFEFVPVIAKKSSYDAHITWVLSLFFLIFFVALIEVIFYEFLTDSWISKFPFLMASPFLAFIAGWLLDKSDRVDRFLIRKSDRVRQVEEKAELLFYRLKLNKLNGANALLLYVSVMERQIVLFPNPEMKIENIKELNQDLLKIVQISFKNGDYEAGFLGAIEHLQSQLKGQFKRTKEVQNFVPNKLIWWAD